LAAAGLEPVFRSDGYVYYVGGRTALGIRRPDADLLEHAHEELAPGIDHLCFRARSREDVDELYPGCGGPGLAVSVESEREMSARDA
jgi:hypothetical protein